MITWMQRHKKYLVVTIWVSVIAFVGAGFVGWGAYDFNSDRSSAVAKVGERKISVREFQMAYNNHYSYYNSLFGGELTQEKAKQMGLEKIALETLVNEALLLNYATDLGLQVLDDELKTALAKDPTFQNESGKFDKDLYYQTLRNAGMETKAYEEHLRKQVLLQKLHNILETKPVQTESNLVASALFMQDRLALRTITMGKDEVEVDEEKLRKFWESQKSSFMSPQTYTIASILTPPDTETKPSEEELKAFYEETSFNYRHDDGKLKTFEEAGDDLAKAYAMELARKESLQTYLAFKKGEIEAQTTQTLSEEELPFSSQELQELSSGDTSKPIPTDEGFLSVKLISVNPPEPMSFDQARPLILDDYIAQSLNEALTQKAAAQLELFTGEDIGLVSRDSTPQIKGLNAEEVSALLAHVFDNNTLRGYLVLDNKAVLYEVLEQNLLDLTKLEEHQGMITESLNQMKRAEVDRALIENLKKRYTTEYYYKGN
jgi:peptidyl-prolyl cis-trans isomerase D